MKKTNYKEKEGAELAKVLKDKRKELNEFQFNLSSGKAKNTKLGHALKKDIARILTVVNARKTS